MLSDGVMGRKNGATRIVGFVDFREEVERDMEEEDILCRKTMQGSQ